MEMNGGKVKRRLLKGLRFGVIAFVTVCAMVVLTGIIVFFVFAVINQNMKYFGCSFLLMVFGIVLVALKDLIADLLWDISEELKELR